MDANSTVAPEKIGRPAPEGQPASPRTWWRVLGVALLVALACLRFPRACMTTGLDQSWSAVLIHAHDHGLQFGHEVAFTYGPLGFLTVSTFSAPVMWLRMVHDLLLCYGLAIGICLVAWRMTLGWRILFLGLFILLQGNIHWSRDDLMIETGLFCWGLLCFVASGRQLRLFTACLVGLAVIGALTKFTLLITAGLTVASLVADLVLRNERKLGGFVLAGFILSFLGGWILSGQKLAGLGAFIMNSLAITSGFNQTMGAEEVNWTGGFIIAGLALTRAAVQTMTPSFSNTGHAVLRRGLLVAWVAGLLFLDWKHGFVRADQDHVVLFLAFVPTIGLALEAMPSTGKQLNAWGRAAGLACALLGLILLQSLTPDFLSGSLSRTFKGPSESVRTLLQPAGYARASAEALKPEHRRAQLPKLRALINRGTVDVFGQNQAYAFFNDLNYHPRPVFQSYSAYTKRLMELNDQFYRSTNSPEFVLFRLAPVDNRFPPLEDAFVLRHLLVNYELVESETPFLLLRRKQTVPVQLTLIHEGDVLPGELIDVSSYGDADLWMEVNLQPTGLGQLRQLLYKPPEVQLAVWSGTTPAQATKYRAPTPMLAAGFLASPLPLDNKAVMDLYDGKPVKRPSAYSAELNPNTLNLWQPKVHFRVYRIENKLARPSS